jgi:hypothetical protein
MLSITSIPASDALLSPFAVDCTQPIAELGSERVCAARLAAARNEQ